MLHLWLYLWWTLQLKVCNGSANATHIECWAPAFSKGMAEEKLDTGEIFIHVDEKNNLWRRRFDYQPTVKVFPFEKEDNLLLLKPGEDEVSLHVCFTAPSQPSQWGRSCDLAAVQREETAGGSALSGLFISVPATA